MTVEKGPSEQANSSEKSGREGPRQLLRRLKARIALDRKRFILYTVLRTLVILTLIRSVILREYENVALCVFSLLLFLLPSFAAEKFRVRIPVFFESIIYLFIYASWILGEIQNYYVLIPGWDTMLHTMNGFLCAAIGFSLVDLLNRRSDHVNLSPIYVTIVAFCFSMTVGVIWEFIEYMCDHLFLLDMQKDTIIRTISTVRLNADSGARAMKISHITKTVIYSSTGDPVTVNGGYLDIGLVDTMKDLFVNLIGALAFSIIGYNFIAKRQSGSIAPQLQLRYETPEEDAELQENIEKAERLTVRQEMSLEAKELFHQPGNPERLPGPEPESGALPQNIVIVSWAAILYAAAAAILLYPVGSPFLNFVLVAVQIGTIAGLLLFLFLRETKARTRGLWLATWCSITSGMLATYKLSLKSAVSAADIRLFLIAVPADLLIPIVLWRMYRAFLRRSEDAESTDAVDIPEEDGEKSAGAAADS